MLNYHELEFGSRTLKLRLTAKTATACEKALGTSIMDAMGTQDRETIFTILHHASQALEHGITADMIRDLYDEYVDAGHSIMDLTGELIELFVVSGFLPIEMKGQMKGKLEEAKAEILKSLESPKA